MSRPDFYILSLDLVKKNLEMQILHCKKSFSLLEDIKLDSNYDDDATTLEKNNIDSLITLVGNGLIVLEAISWEEEE